MTLKEAHPLKRIGFECFGRECTTEKDYDQISATNIYFYLFFAHYQTPIENLQDSDEDLRKSALPIALLAHSVSCLFFDAM